MFLKNLEAISWDIYIMWTYLKRKALMQVDMHFYGTYALARMAGLSTKDAHTIAYSAQFVDDSLKSDSAPHEDGGLLYGIATAHHNSATIINRVVDPEEQRRVWIPFHFIPGAIGDTLSQKLTCTKNSTVVNTLVDEHISKAKNSDYGLHLMGIACHVYADTFSHYGFSGVSSRENKIVQNSVRCEVANPKMKKLIEGSFSSFINKYLPESVLSNWREFALGTSQELVGYLGHAGVGNYPDMPYLKWEYQYEKSGKKVQRENIVDFEEACKALYKKLVMFGKSHYKNHQIKSDIEDPEIFNYIREILCLELDREGRIEAWKRAILKGKLYSIDSNEIDFLNYDCELWEGQKQIFTKGPSSADGVHLDVYKFHQAAAYHRYYVIKDLLPRFGLPVY